MQNTKRQGGIARAAMGMVMALDAAPEVQRSLRAGAADGQLKVQADAAVDRMMRMPSAVGLVQRCPGGCPRNEELRPQRVAAGDELCDGDSVQAKARARKDRGHAV